MTKRTKHVKTVEDVDAAIARWERRFKMAVGKINRLRAERRRLVAKSAKPALLPNLPKMPVDLYVNGETPKVGWVFPEKPKVETPTATGDVLHVTVPVAGTGLAPGAAPGTTVDLDIPGFLLRKPPDQAALRAAQAEAKKAKAVGAAARRKAIAKERKDLGAIPKSKRRWDVNKSRWISD